MDNLLKKIVLGAFTAMAIVGLAVSLLPAGLLTAGFMGGLMASAAVTGSVLAVNPGLGHRVLHGLGQSAKDLGHWAKGLFNHPAPAQQHAPTPEAKPEAAPCKTEQPFVSMGEPESTYHRDQLAAARAALLNFDHTRAPRC